MERPITQENRSFCCWWVHAQRSLNDFGVVRRHKQNFMNKWLCRVISGILALLVFAATSPNVILVRGGISTNGLVTVLLVAFFPFLIVCIFAGRNKTLEHIGWVTHSIALAAALLR